MNFNLILALLEVKGVISHDEAERIAENLSSAPQATHYRDALDIVKRLTDKPANK